MKAMIYAGPKQAVIKDVPAPTPEAGKIKLKIFCCGICGSDIGIYLGTHPRAKAPLILGHEFLGECMEDGKKFKKGDKVVAFPLITCGECLACRSGNQHVCNTLKLIGIDSDGGICEEMYVDEDILFKVPEGVRDKAAVVIEPLAVIVHSMHMVNFQALENSVVIGAGPIGILTGIVLKYLGAEKVFISDIFEKRLKLAEELGLTPVNPNKENLKDIVYAATDNEGADVLFECSGAASSVMEMTDIVRVRGKICMTAVHKAPHEVDLRAINFKEITMVGTRVYTYDEFGQAVRLCEKIQDQVEKVVSHIVPMSEGDKVFDMIADPDCGTCKVVIDCTK